MHQIGDDPLYLLEAGMSQSIYDWVVDAVCFCNQSRPGGHIGFEMLWFHKLTRQAKSGIGQPGEDIHANADHRNFRNQDLFSFAVPLD